MKSKKAIEFLNQQGQDFPNRLISNSAVDIAEQERDEYYKQIISNLTKYKNFVDACGHCIQCSNCGELSKSDYLCWNCKHDNSLN